MVDVGQPAPDFDLIDHNKRQTTLRQFKGRKNVVLSFFVFAFTDG
jgi:peroxiredoxin